MAGTEIVGTPAHPRTKHKNYRVTFVIPAEVNEKGNTPPCNVMSCHAQVMGQYEEIVEVGAGGGRQEHSGPEELEVVTRREKLPKEYSSYALSK